MIYEGYVIETEQEKPPEYPFPEDNPYNTVWIRVYLDGDLVHRDCKVVSIKGFGLIPRSASTWQERTNEAQEKLIRQVMKKIDKKTKTSMEAK